MPIHEWSEIRDQRWDTLFLGNGASIAICNKFAYQSLYDYAEQRGLISNELRRIFEFFDTRDFEMILRFLWHAYLINSILMVDENHTQNAYESLRTALIETVRDLHDEDCDFLVLRNTLKRCANFAKDFRTVVSLNYDLTLYWIMMLGNDCLGNWFKDCFTVFENTSNKCGGLYFRDDWEMLREPYKADGSTLVFYPHGNMILAINKFGEEIKLKLEEGDGVPSLAGKVLKCWEKGEVIPLFVSEGTSEQKERSIRRSVYLSTVYHEVLPNLGQNIVVFGWSFSENDIHLLKAILKNPSLERIAISVYDIDNYNDFSSRVEDMIRQESRDREIEILFYKAQSEGCWIRAKPLPPPP